jgi:hypothetical protein
VYAGEFGDAKRDFRIKMLVECHVTAGSKISGNLFKLLALPTGIHRIDLLDIPKFFLKIN